MKNPVFSLILLGLVSATVALGNEPWLPGGEEVKRAVEARQGKTDLSRLAASMKPGTLVELKTQMPQGLWASPKWKGGRNAGGSGGLHIAGWTDDAHWDSRTGQFFYMGMRQTRKFIAYAETNNTWRSIALDPRSDNPCFRSQFGHVYSSNGFDHERSRFYHRYNSFKDKSENLDLMGGISFFDVLTEKWTKLPDKPGNLGGGMAIEFFGAMDGLISLGPTPGFFSTQRQKWEAMDKSPVSGYHSFIRHNPFRNEVLMAGGNHNPRVVARFKKDGKVERLKDFPCTLRLSSDKIMIDPQTGRYLIWAGAEGAPKRLFEFDSDENEYRVVETFKYPYNTYAMPVMAFIPEYNVIMWAEGKVFLYKHDPAVKYPLVADAVPAVPQK